MIPDDLALVPAMACVNCGRLVPRTAARGVRIRSRAHERQMLNRALRAARRQKMQRS